MKILWISHFLPYPPKGGLLQRGYYLTRELAKHAELDLLAFNQPRLIEPLLPQAADPCALAVEELGKFCRVLGVEDVPLARQSWGSAFIALRSLVSRYPYTINWLASRSFEQRVERALRETHYDVVHFDTISLAYYAHLVQRHSPTSACSLDHHNIESHMLLRRAETGPLLRRLYFKQEGLRLARYERQQCPRFDLNIVCSELDAVRLAESIRVPRVVTIENGVDVDYFQPSDAPVDAHKLIFVGTMNWYPNVDAMRFFLSEVWPVLTRLEPKISIDIIGANPPPDLFEFARKDTRVKVHGFVDDVRPYLAAAAVYVCPIRDGGGTKLKVLDAFASGVPMVAHPVACEGIAAEDGKHVLFAREAEEFAARIQQLLREEIARRRLSMNARKLVEERYSVGSIGRRLHQELASLRGDRERAKCAG